MCTMAKVPSLSAMGAELCDQVGIATSTNLYGPVMVSAIPCSMRLFFPHVCRVQLFVIAETKMWNFPVLGSSIALPPQLVSFGAIPYPCGKVTGLKFMVEQSGPDQGLSHTQTPPFFSPFREQSGGAGPSAREPPSSARADTSIFAASEQPRSRSQQHARAHAGRAAGEEGASHRRRGPVRPRQQNRHFLIAGS
jgi:hypothetical protein